MLACQVGESSESHACEMLHTLSTVFECVSSHASRDAHEQVILAISTSVCLLRCLATVCAGRNCHSETSSVGRCQQPSNNATVAMQGASQIIPRSPFDGLRVPQISLHDYVHRISRYSKCSNVCFCMAFSYLRRLAEVRPGCTPGYQLTFEIDLGSTFEVHHWTRS